MHRMWRALDLPDTSRVTDRRIPPYAGLVGTVDERYFIDAAQDLESESAHTLHQWFMGRLR